MNRIPLVYDMCVIANDCNIPRPDRSVYILASLMYMTDHESDSNMVFGTQFIPDKDDLKYITSCVGRRLKVKVMVHDRSRAAL